MKNQLEIIHGELLKTNPALSLDEFQYKYFSGEFDFIISCMDNYSEQFAEIITTTGEKLIFDLEDYAFLRNHVMFMNRDAVCTTSPTNKGKNRVAVQIAKLIIGSNTEFPLRYKNGNPLDIRKENLEVITHKMSIFKKKIQINNTSGYKGVSWNKNAKAYSASIRVQGKSKHLGYFRDVHQAAFAYNEAAIEFFGENYAYLNDISRIKDNPQVKG